MYLFHSEKKAKNFVKKCEEVITWINDNREDRSERDYRNEGWCNKAIKICEERKIPFSNKKARKAVYDDLVEQDKKDWENLVNKKLPKRLLTTYQLMSKFPALMDPSDAEFSVEEMEVIDE